MDYHLQDYLNKKLAQKRQTEEFIHHMKDWADAKERMEGEITRKIGQGFAGSQFEKRSFRLNAHAQDNFRVDRTLLRGRTAKAGGLYSAVASTRVGTVQSRRPVTGSTIYYHNRSKRPNTKGKMGTVFRKESARPLQEEYVDKASKGYYKDLNVENEEDSQSYGSSLDIKEDDDELDEENQRIMDSIDRNPDGNMLPKIVDASRRN